MARRGENARFWLPVAALLLLAGYSTQKVVRAHVDPSVDSIDYTFKRQLPGRRGSIFDSTGTPLVKSVPVWDYHLDPVALTNRVVRRRGEPPRPRAAIVKTISKALGLDFKKLLSMSDDVKRRYQPLAVSSDPEAHRILADSTLVAGVSIEDRQIRQYLHRRRLSHVLGSVNAEHVGSAGIELKYNGYLTGIPGEIRGMKDARGRELYDKRIVSVDPVPGADIYLTIDHTLQYEAETALAAGMATFEPGAAWCVVMDAKSAAILAMASLPDFDPLRFGTAPDAAKLNRVTNFTYEPGSVMKVITASAAFDSGFAGPDRMYSTARNDERYYRLPGDGSHVWEPTMSVADAIVHSSNIVIGKLGYDLGPARLWSYMRAFGFGSKTGIELPGEEVGILPHWKRWDKATWSRAPIGQGVAVTAIQLASAYQAIANDGVRMKPHVVKRIVDASGADLYVHSDEVVGRPISATAARTIRNVMLGVATRNGTARRAAIPGYSVAGKTGTAQKVIGRRYAPGLYRATFCGMVPASDPRLVVLVTLDFDANRKFHQGGNSAAPVFRRIATAALRYLMIPPDKPDEIPEDDDDDEFDRIMEDRARSIAGA
ncbi:MAG: penicillin-binding protein 2 [Kiritimatiellae bacterium]|nr:penicillin-binding protein 2 [Kiritimatiellia bacterium]